MPEGVAQVWGCACTLGTLVIRHETAKPGARLKSRVEFVSLEKPSRALRILTQGFTRLSSWLRGEQGGLLVRRRQPQTARFCDQNAHTPAPRVVLDLRHADDRGSCRSIEQG